MDTITTGVVIYFVLVWLVLTVLIDEAIRYDKHGKRNRRFRRRHHCLCRQCRFGK
jgi:hypothetical protein